MSSQLVRCGRRDRSESASAGASFTCTATRRRGTRVGRPNAPSRKRRPILSAAAAPDLSGETVIFRVRVDSIAENRVFPGLDDEAEFLIEGTVEAVAVATDEEDQENHDD